MPTGAKDGGYVQAYERVVLDGLVLEPRRRVHYGPIHPKRAREIFLRQALVHNRYRTRAAWHRHNEGVLAEARTWQARLRRRDLMVDAEDRFAFFDTRLPIDVYHTKSFERWRHRAEAENPRVLHLDMDDVMPEPPTKAQRAAHPERLSIEGVPLRLTYRFEPGHVSDGITLTVPHHMLRALRGEQLDWLVPGWLPDKVEALLRTLPKALRRPLVPLPDLARQLAKHMPFARGSLTKALVAGLGTLGHRDVRAGHFNPEALPPHLHMNIRVVDEAGKTVGQARSVATLRAEMLREGHAHTQANDGQPMTTWACGDLPEAIDADHGGFSLPMIPVLADGGTHVVLREVQDEAEAMRVHRAGVRRLLVIRHGKRVARSLRNQPAWPRLEALQRSRGSSAELATEVSAWVLDRATALERTLPRTAAAFSRIQRQASAGAGQVLTDSLALLEAILERYDAVARKLMWDAPPGWETPIEDMTRQLGRLVRVNFLVDTPRRWLTHLPRYLDAIDARLIKLGYGDLSRDRTCAARVDRHVERWRARREAHAAQGHFDPALACYGWWIEEYRVSLFAQDLGTSIKISEARLDAQWQLVDA